jgi:hypothetical protein
MSDRVAIEAQLARRLKMADKLPSMLNLSEELTVAAISHGLDLSLFNCPSTQATEQATLSAHGSSNALVDTSTGEVTFYPDECLPGGWVELLVPSPQDLPEEVPIYHSKSGDCRLDEAFDWLRDMAFCLGWIVVEARTGSKHVEIREVIVDGTPLAERAKGRAWTELMDACVTEQDVRRVANWFVREFDKKSAVKFIQNQLEEAA